jgi:hypothetical protein
MSAAHDRQSAKARAQTAIDAASAALSCGELTEEQWQRAVSDALAEAYLAESDPRWQSGFDGDAELWHEARGLVLDAVPASGSFLDVGAANGHLIECLARWAPEKGIELDLAGLELNPALAAEARRRLPSLAHQIYTGNVVRWEPPHRFTYVRTGLEYVPRGRASALIDRIRKRFLEASGRLLVGPVNTEQRADTIAAFRATGAPTNDVSATDRNGKTRFVIWTFAG